MKVSFYLAGFIYSSTGSNINEGKPHMYARILIIALALFSGKALANEPIETGLFNNKAIYGYDTVAYFTMNKAVKGDDKYQLSWRGAQWYFSSAEHKALFEADPEKYAPQYGGHCAYAMADGDFVSVDEEAFTILEGKLYLNYSKRYRKRWQADSSNFIKKADSFYADSVDLEALAQ